MIELTGNSSRTTRDVDELLLPGVATVGVRLDHEDVFSNVRTSSALVPSRITGTLQDDADAPVSGLAVAVNGRVFALTRPFTANGSRRFAALVPETALRDGANRVEVFLIAGTRSEPHLIRLG